MREMIYTAVLGLGVVAIVIWLVSGLDHGATVKFYESDLRATFFAAFLTLAGFLLSLKTFIVVKLKDMLYDSQSYIKELDLLRATDPELDHYGPLKRLSNWIFSAIALSLTAAVMQFTIGLLSDYRAVLACLAVATAVVYCLSATLVISTLNLRDMFDRCEKQSRDAYEARKKAEAKKKRDEAEKRDAAAKEAAQREHEERQRAQEGA